MHYSDVTYKYGAINFKIFHGSKLANAWLHALAVFIIFLTHLLENDPAITLYTGGVISTVTYAYIAFKEGAKSHLRVNPLSFYMAWYSVGMGISAIYAAQVINSGSTLSFVVKAIEPQDIADGYIIYLVGSVFLHFGIKLPSPERKNKTLEFDEGQDRQKMIWLVIPWIIGMLTSLYPDTFSWMGSFAAILQRMTPAAVAFLALSQPSRFGLTKYTYYFFIIAGTGGAFAASLMSNSKAGIMFSFFPIIWAFLIKKQLWHYLAILLIGLIIFYFGMVAPVIMAARNVEINEGETYAGRIIRVYQSLSAESYLPAQQFQENGLELFLNRQFDAPVIGFLIDDVREYGYRWGETMQRLAYSFIPRILWPEKPTVTAGGWFYMYTGGQKEEGDSDTSVGITATGECYWNFGYPGIIVGMGIIGLTIGVLWRLAGHEPRQSFSQLLLYYNLVLNIVNMADWVTVITGYAILLFIFYSIKFISDFITAR